MVIFRTQKIGIFLKGLFSSLSHYKLRAFFSFLGVSLGIGAMVLIVGAIEGANKKAYEIFEMFGPDAILVISGGEQVGVRTRINTLTLKDLNDIKTHIWGVYEIVPMTYGFNIIVKYKNKNWQTMVGGMGANYFSSWGWFPKEGNIFNENDVKQMRAVGVLGSKVAKELFPNESPIGKYILVGRLPVQVIGVLEERGGAIGRAHLDDRIVMPITTVMKRILNEEKYITLMRIRTSAPLKNTAQNIKALLRKNHGLSGTEPDDFRIRTAEEVLKYLRVVSGTLITFLGTSGLICLIVGGFILANLFYLSISERRKEIGIKRAFGARKKDIFRFFLLEIMLTTTLGGILGVVLSLLGGLVLERFGNIPTVFSYKVLGVAFILSLLVGLISGIRPAMRAAKIDPIWAIRG